MKNSLFLLGTLFSVLLFSCSSSDGETTSYTGPLVLVKEVNYTNSNLETYTNSFTYDGNKISQKIDAANGIHNYTYTGDVITKISHFNKDNELVGESDYRYENGKLIYYTYSVASRLDYLLYAYTHNADGSVSFKFSHVSEENVEEVYQTGILTYQNGNLVKEVTFTPSGHQTTVVYEFDSKNNPYRNILGMKLLYHEAKEMISLNNIIKTTYSDSEIEYKNYFSTQSYTYDANGFPTDEKVYSDKININATKYFY